MNKFLLHHQASLGGRSFFDPYSMGYCEFTGSDGFDDSWAVAICNSDPKIVETITAASSWTGCYLGPEKLSSEEVEEKILGFVEVAREHNWTTGRIRDVVGFTHLDVEKEFFTMGGQTGGRCYFTTGTPTEELKLIPVLHICAELRDEKKIVERIKALLDEGHVLLECVCY